MVVYIALCNELHAEDCDTDLMGNSIPRSAEVEHSHPARRTIVSSLKDNVMRHFSVWINHLSSQQKDLRILNCTNQNPPNPGGNLNYAQGDDHTH